MKLSRYLLLITITILFGASLLMAQNEPSPQLQEMYSMRLLAQRVGLVTATNNPKAIRNKIVKTTDSLVYLVDFKGNGLFLGYENPLAADTLNLSFIRWAQSQYLFRNGVPDYNPRSTTESYLQVDSVSGVQYTYKRPEWIATSYISQEAAPQGIIEFTNGTGQLIRINHTQTKWYKPSQERYFSWLDGAWSPDDVVNIDSLVTIHYEQRILGKKTFADSTKFEKGLSADGLIKAKAGVDATGSNNKAALILKGVQANKDTTVATNYSLTGAHGTINFDCSSGQKECLLPDAALTSDWIFKINKIDDSSNSLVIKNSSGVVIYTVKGPILTACKNNNNIWICD